MLWTHKTKAHKINALSLFLFFYRLDKVHSKDFIALWPIVWAWLHYSLVVIHSVTQLLYPAFIVKGYLNSVSFLTNLMLDFIMSKNNSIPFIFLKKIKEADVFFPICFSNFKSKRWTYVKGYNGLKLSAACPLANSCGRTCRGAVSHYLVELQMCASVTPNTQMKPALHK